MPSSEPLRVVRCIIDANTDYTDPATGGLILLEYVPTSRSKLLPVLASRYHPTVLDRTTIWKEDIELHAR